MGTNNRIILNDEWSVGADGRTWVLHQKLKGFRRQKQREEAMSFCGTKEALMRNIHEHGIICTEEAQKQLYALPSHYAAVCEDPDCTNRKKAEKES